MYNTPQSICGKVLVEALSQAPPSLQCDLGKMPLDHHITFRMTGVGFFLARAYHYAIIGVRSCICIKHFPEFGSLSSRDPRYQVLYNSQLCPATG